MKPLKEQWGSIVIEKTEIIYIKDGILTFKNKVRQLLK